MTDQPSPEVDYADTDAIPNPDAAGLIRYFDPPPGEQHPDFEGGEA